MFSQVDDHAQCITTFCRYFHDSFTNFNSDLTRCEMFRSLDFLKNVITVPIRNNFAILFCRNALRGHLQMKQTKIPLIMRNLELL